MASDLVGILGKKRSGKDTLANVLVANHGFTKIAFADPLRAALLTLDPTVNGGAPWNDSMLLSEALAEEGGWEGVKRSPYGPEVRRLLQNYGQSIREADSTYWVRAALTAADAVPGPVVFSDVRYRNEYAAIDAAGGFLLRITGRGDHGDAHPSETEADDLPVDYEFRNTAGLDQVARYAAGVAVGVRYGRPDLRPADIRPGTGA